MALYTTIHLHNVNLGKENKYAGWFDGIHREESSQLQGFKSTDHYEVAKPQIMGDATQARGYMSAYEFDLPMPELDVVALEPLITGARNLGMIHNDETEHLYSYHIYSDWKGRANWQTEQPLPSISIILGNNVLGRAAAYYKRYNEVHSVEVTNVAGHVAMKRDLLFTNTDFSGRALDTSPNGIALEPRSTTSSLARSVNYFSQINGDKFWPGGVARAGDLSGYIDKA